MLSLLIFLTLYEFILSDKLCDKNVTVIGTVKIGNILHANNGAIFPPNYFRKINSSENLYEACECSESAPCIWKCCADGFLIEDGGKCLPGSHSLLQPFKIFSDDDEKKKMNILYNDPHKHRRYQLDPNETSDASRLFSNGSLLLEETQTILTNDKFCLEVDALSGSIVPFVPFPDSDEPEEEKPFIFPIGMIISEPFLLVTFLIYAIEPSLKSLHGRCLMGNVISLFIAYLFLAITQLVSLQANSFFCISSGFIIQFSFLSHFFWLNVMCFDLWWTFRSLKKASRRKENKKYLLYSLYAWGWPFLIFLVSLIFDFTAALRNNIITPRFGETNCWFNKQNTWALLFYFYLPIGLVVLSNIVFFIATAINILRLKKETAILKGPESRKNSERAEKQKQRFALYLKLFAVMGVNWSLELISWKLDTLSYIWYITDFMNTLQGVFIFLIFVWKENVRKLIYKRVRCSHVDSLEDAPSISFHSSRNSKV